MTLKNIKQSAITVILLAFIASSSLANDKPSVTWGGLGFASFGKTSLSPAAEKLRVCAESGDLANCQGADIYMIADEMFETQNFDHIGIEYGYIEAAQRIGYVVSPIINSEFVLRGKVNGQYFYTFLVLGNLMLYEVEPDKTTFLSSVPFGMQIDEYFPKKLSEGQELAYLENWYTARNKKDNFFAQMAMFASDKIKRPLSFSNGVKFTNIEFSDSVSEILKATSDLDSWRRVIAAFAEARLAANTGRSVIPSSVDGANLELLFKDGSRKINLPPALFDFEIFAAVFDRTAQGSEWTCFNVGARYIVKSFGEELVNAPMVHGEDSCANLPAANADPLVFFPANLFEQINSVMEAFSAQKGADNYVRAHAMSDHEGIAAAIASVRKQAFEN